MRRWPSCTKRTERRPPRQLFFRSLAIGLGAVVSVVFRTGGPAPHPDPVREADGRAPPDGSGSTYMPLRVNMAGVIPVIFAAALLALRRRSVRSAERQTFINQYFSRTSWAYLGVEAA